VAAALVMATACKDFLKVENPNSVAASDVNAQRDATTLAQSALQDFAAAWGQYVVFGGIYSGELWSADVNSPGNLTSVRLVDPTMTDGYLSNMARARVSGTKVVASLKGTSGESSNNAAIGWMVSGYAFLAYAEYFCTAAVDGGPSLTTANLLDSAVANLTNAITIGAAVGDNTGIQLSNAARVARARAQLMKGNTAEATADANAVKAGFNYNLTFLNDLTNIQRLGNYVWYIDFNISTLSVIPALRGLTDPRIITIPPNVNNLQPMDGSTPMWSMAKYSSYSAPIRLASKIEADYVAAEAQGTTTMLAQIQARRAANSQPAYAGATDAHSVLVEFLTQRTYEFYVEGKHMGDFRRYPNDLPFLVPAGTPYRKPNVPAYSSGYHNKLCWPISVQETTNNPNHPQP
jgi:hypothetical protein